MKLKHAILTIFIISISCNKDNGNEPNNDLDYKQSMREFVIKISQYSKAIKPGFIVIPQNGIELITANGDISDPHHSNYLDAIDANGQEDLFYGYHEDDQATPASENIYLIEFLTIAKNTGKKILVTDYCSTPSKMADSYLQNSNQGFISFAANQRELNNIPNYPTNIYQENNAIVTNINQAKNFLYLINFSNFITKNELINAIKSTNYDLIIMDLFFNDQTAFIESEINQLKTKANGGTRLVVSYMSIGEAENYRYYWQQSWNTNKPIWLDKENPDWAGNYKVKYWHADWQNIIFGNDNSYLKKILIAEFDGVYLDIIDAFENYETK